MNSRIYTASAANFALVFELERKRCSDFEHLAETYLKALYEAELELREVQHDLEETRRKLEKKEVSCDVLEIANGDLIALVKS